MLHKWHIFYFFFRSWIICVLFFDLKTLTYMVIIMQDDVNLEIDNREFDLETLIVDGAKARIPIEVEFPIYHEDGTMTYELS